MNLHSRKLWGDRAVWLLVVASWIVILVQYLNRGADFNRYLFYGWSAVVLLLLALELRLGRRRPEPSENAVFAGWAKFVAEEHPRGGGTEVDFKGQVSGTLEFVPKGILWTPHSEQPGAGPRTLGWDDLFAWRLRGVVPMVSRASGYLALTTRHGHELVFAVQGLRRWREAMREAQIEGRARVAGGSPVPDRAEARAARKEPEASAPAVIPLPELAGSLELPCEPEPQPVTAEPVGEAPPPIDWPEAVQPAAPEESDVVERFAALDAEELTLPTEPEPVPAPEPEPVPAPEPEPVSEPVAASQDRLEPVIGLECHVELSTASKVFCSCPTQFGAAPNTQICPVCTGQPGSLPVLNAKAVEFAIRIALALNCRVASRSVFHRKNYFYPDMPKNFQISQYDVPLASAGYLEFEVDEGDSRTVRRVGIHRVHLEEDTGKTSHGGGDSGRIADAAHALVDYNRAGVPLVEIVSEPDIRSPSEARAYLCELRSLLESLGVSDVRMDQGSLRCDANVSLRPSGSVGFGTKTEVKNMNSVRSVQAALEHEIERQSDVLSAGDAVRQETRHYDESTGRTSSLRSKEQAFDYRYFPEPDLVPLVPERAWIERIRSTLPELPSQRRRRFTDRLGLSEADARTLTATRGLADAFEKAVAAYGGEPSAIARWYLGELAAAANDKGVEAHLAGVAPEQVSELQKLVDEGTVSISQAKGRVLRAVLETGKSPSQVASEMGGQISDAADLEPIVDEVLSAHPDAVEQFRGGKQGSINFLKGQVMKRTQGRANPATVEDVLRSKLA